MNLLQNEDQSRNDRKEDAWEVNGDLSRQTSTWTLHGFYSHFSELYSWLNSVQETIYGKQENITDKALRAHCENMVLEKSSALKLFNDQASHLVQLHPEVQEEVSWRTMQLNSKWDSILSILGPCESLRYHKQSSLLDPEGLRIVKGLCPAGIATLYLQSKMVLVPCRISDKAATRHN
ncbi:unnamed protein product [Acanthoscelides obtectus]|uniref:Uncharacterized protein n=1 Tax=Acanthoscelides obtectus TaxID=200917 RepID=A0A9P0P345_ACAOB|nr:unnamed protein product [Acanthoscelides obtectus]CAK1628455.1 hypothetical protein AOBTE_LOCUS5225 [Acanthoscelides obtectus]